MPPDDLLPKHDFTRRPDPEREMVVRLTIEVPVFGRDRQVHQTKAEVERYVQLHVSHEARVVETQVRPVAKPLPGVPLNGFLHS